MDLHVPTLDPRTVSVVFNAEQPGSRGPSTLDAPVPAIPQPLVILPQPGDVLVANLSATTEYDVSIVPGPMFLCGTHQVATAKACDLAHQLRVDAWLTEDRTHFMRLASHR